MEYARFSAQGKPEIVVTNLPTAAYRATWKSCWVPYSHTGVANVALMACQLSLYFLQSLYIRIILLWCRCSASLHPNQTDFSEEQGKSAQARLVRILARVSCIIVDGSAGIPMGLGTGIKLGGSDKEKDRDKSDDKDHEKLHHLQSLKRKDKERDEVGRGWKSSDDLADEILVNFNHSGWTSLLEHWLCHRTQAHSQIQGEHAFKDITASPKRHSLHRRVAVKESEMGPYVPLVKERMMGLYLSIYIHRDLRDLVEGMLMSAWLCCPLTTPAGFSKSAVTAGLIGGRVGNKGGVGISLKIDGTTFLFLNAHLAGV